MAFFAGLGGQTFGDYGLLGNPYGPGGPGIVPETNLAEPYRSLGRGGLFGTGVTGGELSGAFGAAQQLLGGQQQPPAPYQFHPLQMPHADLSALNGPGVQRRPVPPLDLAQYLRPFGYGRSY